MCEDNSRVHIHRNMTMVVRTVACVDRGRALYMDRFCSPYAVGMLVLVHEYVIAGRVSWLVCVLRMYVSVVYG